MVIGLVGFIGSGKGTVSDILVKQGYQTDSFAAPLKDLCAAVFGWPRELLEGDTMESRGFRETPDMFWSRKLDIANFTPRLALQLLGTDIMRDHFHQDIWLNSLEYRFHKTHNANKVISDCRFRNELKIIQRMGGKVVWVQRGKLPEWYQTACDATGGNVLAERIMETRHADVHRSEWDWAGYPVDKIITNDGSMEDLNHAVLSMMNEFAQTKLRMV
jgi:hypothetical protein